MFENKSSDEALLVKKAEIKKNIIDYTTKRCFAGLVVRLACTRLSPYVSMLMYMYVYIYTYIRVYEGILKRYSILNHYTVSHSCNIPL